MPVHQPLALLTFVKAIPPDLLQRYLDHFPWEKKPTGWAVLNGDALNGFLNQPENEQFRGIVMEEFRRMNDICAAWSRYLLFGGSPKLSIYPLGRKDIRVTAAKTARLQESLKAWFTGKAKGNCKVKYFADAGEAIILISRGSYMRTVACWQGDEIAFTTFRPASEDVLVYDAARGELTVKASQEGERQQYLQAFAVRVAGDAGLADIARHAKLFTLKPIQDGSFDYSGDAEVTKVELVRAGLKVFDGLGSYIELRSSDVLAAIARSPQYSLRGGELTYAKLRFHIEPIADRRTTVTFEIEPPLRTDLAQKRYADVVERYLVRQGVKLS